MFIRWKNHMMSSGENIDNDIRVAAHFSKLTSQKHRLNAHAAWVFFEVRPKLIRNPPETASQRAKLLAFLWVSEEVLKLVPRNPPWAKSVGQLQLGDLNWTDESRLKRETSKNEKLILNYSRLILTGRIEPDPSLVPNGKMKTKPPSVSKKRIKLSDFKPPPPNFRLGELIRSGASRLRVNTERAVEEGIYFIKGRFVRVGSSIRMFKNE